MVGTANTLTDKQGEVVIEATKRATALDGLVATELEGKMATWGKNVLGASPAWTKNTWTWGKIGVAKEGRDKEGNARGTKAMFVGYPSNHKSNIVCTWNEETNNMVTGRGVIWPSQVCFKKLAQGTNAGTQGAQGKATDGDKGGDSSLVEALDEGEDDEGQGDPKDQAAMSCGRFVRPVDRLSYESLGTAADIKYQSNMTKLDGQELVTVETAQVGAGLGRGYGRASELKVADYHRAMVSPDREHWKTEAKNAKVCSNEHDTLAAVPRSELLHGTKVLTSACATEKKPSGKFCGRINLHGFQQMAGKHCTANSTAVPAASSHSARIVLVLLAVNPKWTAWVEDVEGAFLQGISTRGEEIYTEVPDGFGEFYPPGVVLRLGVPICGDKQSVNCFYKVLVSEAKHCHSRANPCLFFVWKDGRLVLVLLRVDGLMLGEAGDVQAMRNGLGQVLDCKLEGPLKEHVENKIDTEKRPSGARKIKFTQLILVQKMEDKFDLPTGKVPRTPVVAGQKLTREDRSWKLDTTKTTKHQSGMALLVACGAVVMSWDSKCCREPSKADFKSHLDLLQGDGLFGEACGGHQEQGMGVASRHSVGHEPGLRVQDQRAH